MNTPSDDVGRLLSGNARSAEELGAPTEPGVDRPSMQMGTAIGHYELIRKLGQGGMGVVYLARDTRLGRLVAIKILFEAGGPRADRLLAEARLTARCRHENIVVIHDVDEIHGRPYMVLEYVKGRTLRAWMVQRGDPVPPTLAVEIMIPVARALVCAHEAGIVHRDLKPDNVLLDDAGSIKVLDFGIAKQLEAPLVSRISGVLTGGAHAEESTVVGTAPYMSPEQLLGVGVDARADLWAVGIILYELVTGAHPLAPFSLDRLVHVVDLGRPMPRASDRPGLGALGTVIDRCLKKRKEERLGSAKALLDALAALLPAQKAIAIGEDDSPFAGLAAFQEADAARFFGRDRDVVAARSRLRQEPLLVVAGPSGAGKSSFVRAGVIPALKRSGERWEAFVLRPGLRPLSALADVIAQAAEADPAGAPALPDHEQLEAILRARPGHLGSQLRARCRREGQRILIFVDQFEELYTLGAAPEERAAFVACLEGAADDASSPVRALIAIRADFLERMADERHFIAGVPRGLSFLSPMRRAGLREALERPLEATGHRFETAEMVDHMLGVLESTQSPLPLLQFTAAKLWEARDRDRRILTRHSYDRIGGVAGALSVHADAVLAGLSLREQRLARAVLLRLVTPERTRAVVSLDELCELAHDVEAGSRDAVEQVIRRLCDARLLLVETGGEREGTLVELIHESLIDRWAKLGQWLAASEQDTQLLARLRVAAQQWEAGGRSEGLLWRDRAAKEARSWYERRSAEPGASSSVGLGERDKRYLLAVIAFADRARRLRRQLAVGATAALGVIALVVLYLAIRAGHEKDLAQAEAVQARNATRMAAASELRADPTTVLAILREVEPPDVPRGWAALARWALHGQIAEAVLVHPEAVKGIGYSPDGERIATASLDGLVRVWRADGTGDPIVLGAHQDWVYSVAWSPDGKRVVTASWDRTARVWNADGTGEPIVLRGHAGPVHSAAWSPDGKRIVTASADRTARIWSADGTGAPIILRGHEAEVSDAEWSPDGKRIVTASGDRTARIWNADGTGDVTFLRGHDNRVLQAAWSPDGKRIATASWDKTARVWDLDGGAEPRILRGHDDGVSAVAWRPDGKRIVTGSWDRTARVWHADAPSDPQALQRHDDSVMGVALSPDGKRIVTASDDGTARVWNADGTGETVVLRGHDGAVKTAEWSPDGKRIVTASDDGTARVWNADGAGEPLVLRGHEGRVSWAAWSPDGKHIATASDDGTARVWNADGAGEPLALRGHEGRVTSVAWSPDGRHIATASADRTVRIWNADGAGKPIIVRGHDGEVYSVAWSPDGKRLVTASLDKTARVWSADGTGGSVVLHGHEHWVLGAAWSPDGKRIATASQDKTVRVWNADGTGDPLVLRSSESPLNSVAWSPDGKRIVAAADDGVVRMWTDLEPLHGVADPKLWTATTYCMPVERRMDLLHVPKATALAEREACLRHVAEARSATGAHG